MFHVEIYHINLLNQLLLTGRQISLIYPTHRPLQSLFTPHECRSSMEYFASCRISKSLWRSELRPMRGKNLPVYHHRSPWSAGRWIAWLSFREWSGSWRALWRPCPHSTPSGQCSRQCRWTWWQRDVVLRAYYRNIDLKILPHDNQSAVKLWKNLGKSIWFSLV